MITKSTAKRVMDVLAATAGLILLFPLFIVIAIAVYLRMGRPVLYKQLRPGLNGHPFLLYKFRSMRNTTVGGKLLPDERRLTTFGQFLRKSSLDELPVFWNVLKGEMSLVGPRPLLMQYIPRYNPEQRRRHEVRPGITGWAQSPGRNALSWEERFRLDVGDDDHINFWLDLKILYRTLFQLFSRKGISAEGHATMPEFMGSPTETREQ
jgi:sugar transferase EpsL